MGNRSGRQRISVIDILIPCLGRPQNARHVTDSIHQNTTSDHLVLFICSKGDREQIEACYETGEAAAIVDWEAERGDFARKINHGYSLTEGEFFLIGADDLRFYPGWDTEVLKVAESGAGVIGINDLGHAQVKRGRLSTHPLVNREYIRDQGGTFDNSGEVLSEVYDHQYVDVELCETAKARGVWAFARRSVVEHLHPRWGKGVQDATYEKAFRSAREDALLNMERLRLMRRQLRYTSAR